MTTRQIEARTLTAEPLVETNDRGNLVPSGRRMRAPMPAADGQAPPYPDGLNSYKLDALESLAFNQACNVVRGLPREDGGTEPELTSALTANNLGAGADAKAIAAFIADWRTRHSLPKYFSPLDPGDECSNFETVSDEVAAAAQSTPTPALLPTITHVDELTPAIAAPSTEASTHILVDNRHVGFLHRVIDDLEAGVKGADDLVIRAFRKVFHRGAAA